MTPAELWLYVEGFQKREKGEWQRAAAMSSWILSGLVKNAPSPAKLLGEESAEDAPDIGSFLGAPEDAAKDPFYSKFTKAR